MSDTPQSTNESPAAFVPPEELDEATRARIEQLRAAAQAHQKLRLHYADIDGQRSERVVRPLGCFYWHVAWTLAVWCETRVRLCSLRIEGIEQLTPLDERFADEPGKSVDDLLRLMEAEMQARDSATDA